MQIPPLAVPIAAIAIASPSLVAADFNAKSARSVLDSLSGRWEGTLEYKNYGSGERVKLPSTMTVEPSMLTLSASRVITFTDPGYVVRNEDIVTFDPESARLQSVSITSGEYSSADQYTIESWEPTGPNNWTLVLSQEGQDDNRPADIRLTQTYDGASFRSRKDVRYTDDGAGDWEFRNEITYERAAFDPSELVGTWAVDLRPTPAAAPYTVELVIASVGDGTLEGTFYNGSAISNANVETTKAGVSFAFTTFDGSELYGTQGTLIGGELRGATHAPGRGFLMPWRGRRAE
ncbi:MAG: hypothetical protein AAGB51_03055 [Planctomycetota bacterium]